MITIYHDVLLRVQQRNGQGGAPNCQHPCRVDRQVHSGWLALLGHCICSGCVELSISCKLFPALQSQQCRVPSDDYRSQGISGGSHVHERGRSTALQRFFENLHLMLVRVAAFPTDRSPMQEEIVGSLVADIIGSLHSTTPIR